MASKIISKKNLFQKLSQFFLQPWLPPSGQRFFSFLLPLLWAGPSTTNDAQMSRVYRMPTFSCLSVMHHPLYLLLQNKNKTTLFYFEPIVKSTLVRKKVNWHLKASRIGHISNNTTNSRTSLLFQEYPGLWVNLWECCLVPCQLGSYGFDCFPHYAEHKSCRLVASY